MEKRSEDRMAVLAALCWVLGWAPAVAYGHGFEFQRMVVAIPGVVLAGLVVLPGLWKGRGVWTPGLLVVGLAGVYVALRALYSPVWDLGKMDLLLVCLGAISLLVGARIADSDRAVGVLLGGLVVIFAANAGVALVQGTMDPGYAFLRGAREGQVGVSGLFWHRNYLAGMLELMVPVFLAAALVGGRGLLRMGFGVLLIAGLALAYWSQSRAGLIAVGFGCAVVFVVWLLRGWQGWSGNAKVGVSIAGIAAVVVFAAGTMALASKVSTRRGQDESLEAAMGTTDARLAFAGLAYDQWQEAPLIGTGARSFSYLVVRNWDRGRTDNGLGNPEMAHNDYLQTLAEYGALGLILLVGSVGLILGRGVKRAWARKQEDQSVGGLLEMGAIGGICGAMVHSGVDFSLHILPNTLLFAFLTGVVLRAASRGDRPVGAGEREGGVIGRLIGGAYVAMAVAGAFVAGGRELMALPAWFQFEQGAIDSGVTEQRKDELKAIIEKAPDFGLARYHGRITLEQLLVAPDQKEALVPEGLWAMRMAVERHPFDGESRLKLARVLEAEGDDVEAAREYLKGIELTWRRENKYGGMRGFSDHLSRRAEDSWLARKPGLALTFYERAKEYLERSWELGFRPEVWTFSHPKYLAQQKHLAARIEFLEGAGIQAESLDGVIPGPPEE